MWKNSDEMSAALVDVIQKLTAGEISVKEANKISKLAGEKLREMSKQVKEAKKAGKSRTLSF